MAPLPKKTSETANTINKLVLLKKFAYAEDLAHTLAYDDSVHDGAIIELLDYNGQTQNAKVHRIPIKNQSIIANILEIQSFDPNLPNRVEVIWRGTHDKGSAIADLDPTSPGYSEYVKDRNIILSEVNKAIGRMSVDGKQVSIGSYGHSLGGSLAQVFAVDVMDAMVQNHQEQHYSSKSELLEHNTISIEPKLRTNFSKVRNITIGTFNAAGVSKATSVRAKKLDHYLHNHPSATNKQEQPKISYFAALNANDGVQQTGEASILADSPTSEVYLLKTKVEMNMFGKILTGAISLGGSLLVPKLGPSAAKFAKVLEELSVKGIGTLNAHTAKLFDKKHNLQSSVMDFELYQSKFQEDRTYITQQLNNKAKILQNPILKTFQATTYYFADKLLNRHHPTSTSEPKVIRSKTTVFSNKFNLSKSSTKKTSKLTEDGSPTLTTLPTNETSYSTKKHFLDSAHPEWATYLQSKVEKEFNGKVACYVQPQSTNKDHVVEIKTNDKSKHLLASIKDNGCSIECPLTQSKFKKPSLTIEQQKLLIVFLEKESNSDTPPTIEANNFSIKELENFLKVLQKHDKPIFVNLVLPPIEQFKGKVSEKAYRVIVKFCVQHN